jgi:hypothetical protein
MQTTSSTVRARPRLAFRLIKWLCVVFLALLVAGMTGWSALFLWMSPLPGEPLRIALATVFAVGTLASFVLFKKRWRTLLVFLGIFAVLVIWFYSIPPSNDRPWATEVAMLPTATVNGNLVTIKNIRNFDYRTVADFTPRYYDKTFDLDKLQSVDLSCIYWGSPAIAHIIVSFGFGGDDFVAFSIEMRNMKGQENSMVKSFFRQYELIYIVADERDVIRVRTNFRTPREQVHMYRTRMPIENQRKLFLSYAAKVDSLTRHPQWYNTLEDNCTTGVLHRVESYGGRARYNWRILLSGYTAAYLYNMRAIDTTMPFAELEKVCLVNAKAEAANNDPDFSVKIRAGLPMPKPYTMAEFAAMK